MKKLLLATVLALGAFDAAYASQYQTPWYEGQYFCDIEGSKDRLGIKYTTKSVPNTHCDGDRCSINGYKVQRFASVRMSGWNRAYDGMFVVDHDTYITFYFIDNQRFVRLDKPRRYGRHYLPARGTYASGGKNWNITCRKG